MKYYLAKLNEKNGEYEYRHYLLLQDESDEKALEQAESKAAAFYDLNGTKQENTDWYEFYDGEIMVRVNSVEEITEAEYETLKKLL